MIANKQRLSCTLFFIFPKMRIFDAEFYWIKCVFGNACGFLCFVILECTYSWSAHEEDNQYADNVNPSHNAQANITEIPDNLRLDNRAKKTAEIKTIFKIVMAPGILIERRI